MKTILALAALAAAPSAALAQDRQGPDPASEVPSHATTEAWQRLLSASLPSQGEPGAGDPITAFRLKAEILTRDGVQTNETRIDYSYLAPTCIRFLLSGKREVGRFGTKQREYWLREGEEVVALSGREYSSDRKQIGEMHAVARNFVALSDPARLRITRMALLSGAPADVPAHVRRTSSKLTWLRLVSPDFALLRRESSEQAAPPTYVVDLGLQPGGLPRFAVIREETAAGQTAGTPPMLIRLGRFEDRSDFKIPLQLEVFSWDHRAREPVFADKPGQEIYITEVDLRAPLTVDDFRP